MEESNLKKPQVDEKAPSAENQDSRRGKKKPLHVVQVIYNWLFAFSILLSVTAILISIMSYRQSSHIFVLSNKPTLQIDESASETGGFKVALWNSGPGTAYDITCEVHLTETIGNIGEEWVVDVLKAADYFENKSPETLLNRQNYSADDDIAVTNPPSVLSPGLKEAYFFTTDKYRILQGLFVIIRYKDNQGNSYYSLWDGYRWVFDKGSCAALPVYKEHNQVALFYQRLLESRAPIPNDHIFINWLQREASVLQSKGYKTMHDEMMHKEKIANEWVKKRGAILNQQK